MNTGSRRLRPRAGSQIARYPTLGPGVCPRAWRGVPGPGVFPFAIGLGLVARGLTLALSARRVSARDTAGPSSLRARWDDVRVWQAAGILMLLAVYVALWDAVPFVWRTPILLLALYRIVGEPWLRGALIAAAATAVLAVVFDALLRVRL